MPGLLRLPDHDLQTRCAVSVLSVIIPAYNEEATIREILDRVVKTTVKDQDGNFVGKEIIVVDDGSTDQTPALLKQWEADQRLPDDITFRVLTKRNGGKGSAVREGIMLSTGDAVIIQDADLEYDPADYSACVGPILAGTYDVVYGSRERFAANRSHSAWRFYIGGLVVTYWFNLLYGTSMTDEPTCYKTFRGDLVRALLFKGDKFDWEPELTAKLIRLGYPIHEVPIAYHPRKVDEGKKIGWKDGVQALWLTLLWRVLPIGSERRKLAALPKDIPNLQTQSRNRRAIWMIAALACALRVLLALPGLGSENKATFSRPDTGTYESPALGLLEHHRYVKSPTDTSPASLRPPGFPVFLAAVYGLTGHSWKLAVLALCLIGGLTVIPVMKMAELLSARFNGPALWPGIIAGLLFTLNITALSASPLLLSDTLAVWFGAWQAFFLVRFGCRYRLFDFWLSIFCAAVSCLVRPTAMPWILPALFILAICLQKSWKHRLVGAVGAIALYIVIPGAWMARNHAVDAGFRLDSNIGNTLRYHNVPALLSVVTGESAETIRKRWQTEDQAHFAADPEAFSTTRAKVDYQLAQAKPYLKENLPTYLRLHIQPASLIPDAPTFLELLGMTQTGQGTLDVLRRQGIFAATKHYFGDKLYLLAFLCPLLAIVGLTYLASFLELLRWLLRKQWLFFFIFMALVPYYLVLPGPIVMPRYQLPAVLTMCSMAGFLLTLAYTTWRKKKSPTA